MTIARNPLPLRRVALAILAAVSALGVYAEAHADGLDPRWGLQWGQSVSAVQAQAQDWRLELRQGEEERYSAAALPLQHPAFPRYMMVFQRGALREVLAFSRNFRDDSKGQYGKQAFFGVGLALQMAYGKPEKDLQYSLPEARWPSGGFYECLNMPGCGDWVSTWTAPSTFTVLQLKKAAKPGEGYLLLRAMQDSSK